MCVAAVKCTSESWVCLSGRFECSCGPLWNAGFYGRGPGRMAVLLGLSQHWRLDRALEIARLVLGCVRVPWSHFLGVSATL